MRLYRFKEDIPATFVIAMVFGIQLYTFFCVDNLGKVFCIMLGLLACSASPGSISHNHHHTNTFTKSWMNRIYEVVMFMETGILPFAWTLHHNLGHHKHYLEPEHDTAPWQHKNGRVMARVYYDVVNAALIYPEVMRMGRLHPGVYRHFKVWAVVSLALLGSFLLLDPVKALILFVLPMPVMYIGLLDNTYMQHSDLDVGSDFTASRNSMSRLYNKISWNLGYHTAHHMRPNVHWSRLPALHEQIKHQIPRGVICNSVLLSACTYRHSRDAFGVGVLQGKWQSFVPAVAPAVGGAATATNRRDDVAVS